MKIDELLKQMIEKNASDMIISTNSPPKIRVNGKLFNLTEEKLSRNDTKELIYSMLADEQKHILEKEKGLEFSFGISQVGRFRINVYQQRGSLACVIRSISVKIPKLEELGIPSTIKGLLAKTSGLILVTGSTGSGKSTTLASIIDFINNTREAHIITIEDPIIYVYENKLSIIDQRQIYNDANSFIHALRQVGRQKPDILLLDELRDAESLILALNIAESGCLVLASLSTNEATRTIHKIIDMVPPSSAFQIQVQLSSVLEAIICQQLLPKADNSGRVLALEILVCNSAVRNLIRLGEIDLIPTVMQTGIKEGMKLMNQSLKELYEKKIITFEVAYARSYNPTELATMIKTI